MDNLQNQQRLKSIYRMLLEIANGNLAFRLTVKDQDTNFEELVIILNKVAEKMEQLGYINPYNNKTSNDEPALIVQKVQDYIQKHLEDKLPTTNELSIMFGTNEFTLKESFRNFLQTSIYQYYNDERLKKVHLLIQHTPIPLKEIALMCGFNDYTNFFKAFKKKYHYTPSDVKRDTDLSTLSED